MKRFNAGNVADLIKAECFEYNAETGRLMHAWLTVAEDGEMEMNMLPIIDKAKLFGRDTWGIHDGRALYTYQTKASVIKKMAAIFTSQFVIALSTPGCADASIPKHEWDEIFKVMHIKVKELDAVKAFFKAS